MNPYLADPDFTLYVGDVREVLAKLSDESIHCCVTSPPYWGLRDYGVDGQLGLEPTPDEYVANMVDVFRGVRRVLRSDGTCWLNIGDSYASGKGESGQTTLDPKQPHARRFGKRPNDSVPAGLKHKDLVGIPWRLAFALQADGWYLRSDIIWAKPNPMPESVTDRPTKAHEYLFLLTKSSRYFYDADAIAEPATWHGPNGRPKEGPHAGQMHARAAAARPQQRRAAELAAQHGLTEEHFEAIRSVGITDTGKALTTTLGAGRSDPEKQRLADEAKVALGGYYREFLIPLTRNARSVWTIQTQQYADAHFAVFPKELPERCILAGTSERGCCPECGAPWERETEKGPPAPEPEHRQPGKRLEPGQAGNVGAGNMGFRASRLSGQEMARWKAQHPDKTLGWRPTCECSSVDLRPILTPTGERADDDPTMQTGRKGMNRPRGENEGRRPITRYEQAEYARQLRASPARPRMEADAGEAFAHYIRTDISGARPVPGDLLERWIAEGMLERVEIPEASPLEPVPCTVIDPFMGSGTTAVVARTHGRRAVGIELKEEYARLSAERSQQLSLLAA